MKLIYEELRKLWGQRIVQSVFLLSLVFSVGLMFISKTSFEQNNTPISNYAQLKAAYDDRNINESIIALESKLDTIILYQDYQNYINIPEIAVDMRQTYFHEEFLSGSFILEYQDFIETQDIDSSLTLYRNLIDYYTLIHNYPNYVKESLAVIDNLENQPFWKNYSEGKKVYYDDLRGHFEDLKSTQLMSENYMGVSVLLDTMLEPVLIMMGVFIVLCAFELDTVTKMNDLLLITNRGRTKTTLSKLAAVFISIAGSFIIVYGLLLFINTRYFGPIQWSSPIQSYLTLYFTPFNQTLVEWFSWMVLGQFIGVLVLSMFFGGLYLLIPNRMQALILFLLVYGISAGLFLTIQDTMLLVPFKYLNLYALTQARTIFQSYAIVEALGFTFSKINYIFVVGVSLTLISMGIIVVLRNRQPVFTMTIHMNVSFMSEKIIRKMKRFAFELYKVLILQKGVIGVLVILYFFGSSYFELSQFNQLKEQDQNLVLLYQEYGGVLDGEKRMWIESQYLFYETLNQELSKNASDYELGLISSETYHQFITEYLTHSQDRQVFNEFYEHYINNSAIELIYPKGYQALFSINTETREFKNALGLLVLFIFLMSPLISFDGEQDPDDMYSITKMGLVPLLNTKLKLAYGIAFVSVLVVSVFDLVTFSSIYQMNAWNSAFSSIVPNTLNLEAIPQFVLNASLWQYLVLVWCVRMFGAFVTTSIILWVSSIVRSSIISTLMTIMIILVPLLMSLVGVSLFQAVSLHHLLMGNAFIMSGLNSTVILFYGLLMLGLTYALYHKFTTR